VLGITPAQFSSNLRIQPLPESGEISGGLDGPLVWRQQMYNQWNFTARDARCFPHAEEVL
jgi:hypothetical protein